LVCAAHEIIHALFRARGHRGLLFDLAIIPKDMRQKWGSGLKKAANFLKHARDDINGVYDFKPINNEIILLVCCVGLRRMGEPAAVEDSAIIYWNLLHFPERLTVSEADLTRQVPVSRVAKLRKLDRHEFLQAFEDAWRVGARPVATIGPSPSKTAGDPNSGGPEVA
jgi:hypothetical protein